MARWLPLEVQSDSRKQGAQSSSQRGQCFVKIWNQPKTILLQRLRQSAQASQNRDFGLVRP